MLVNLNDTCELTKTIILNSDTKFSFYYYMYGRQIGTFLLLADQIILWSLSGSQEAEWIQVNTTLPKGTYEVNTRLTNLIAYTMQ